MRSQRKSPRLKEYDYSTPAWYFVTMCTIHMQSYFGEIKNGKMNLNHSGKVVYECLTEIPNHFSMIDLDYYVVMPNHIHAIIIIDNVNDVGVAKFATPTNDRSKMLLSKVIQQFKRACTMEIKKSTLHTGKIWQRSFYDRIIRDENELYKITKYIEQNPLKWEIEKGLPGNIDL